MYEERNSDFGQKEDTADKIPFFESVAISLEFCEFHGRNLPQQP